MKEQAPTLQLQPADIVFVHSDGPVGWLIRRETKSKVNHVAMVVDVDPVSGRPWIMDAQPPVVLRTPLARYRGELVAIYRPINISGPKRAAIVARCRQYHATPYGFFKILLHKLHLQRFCFWDGAPICSYSVAVPYFREGLRFGRTRAAESTPASIYAFVQAHPDKYEPVMKLGELEDVR